MDVIEEDDKSSIGYLAWTQQMDEYLLDVLLEQKNNSQKPDRNFSHTTYDVAVKAMNERFTVKVNNDKVMNRLKTLKKKMDIDVEVFRHGSGFGWNDIIKQIKAPPEVWAELIKTYPDATKVRKSSMPSFTILHEIFEKDRTTGEAAESAKEKNHRWEKEGRSTRLDDIDHMVEQDEIILENMDESGGGIRRSNVSHVPITHGPSSKSGKKKSSKFDELNQNIAVITKSMTKIATALDRATTVTQQGRRRIFRGKRFMRN